MVAGSGLGRFIGTWFGMDGGAPKLSLGLNVVWSNRWLADGNRDDDDCDDVIRCERFGLIGFGISARSLGWPWWWPWVKELDCGKIGVWGWVWGDIECEVVECVGGVCVGGLVGLRCVVGVGCCVDGWVGSLGCCVGVGWKVFCEWWTVPTGCPGRMLCPDDCCPWWPWDDAKLDLAWIAARSGLNPLYGGADVTISTGFGGATGVSGTGFGGIGCVTGADSITGCDGVGVGTIGVGVDSTTGGAVGVGAIISGLISGIGFSKGFSGGLCSVFSVGWAGCVGGFTTGATTGATACGTGGGGVEESISSFWLISSSKDRFRGAFGASS